MPFTRPRRAEDDAGVVMVADRGGRASRAIVQHGLAALERAAGHVSRDSAGHESSGILTAIPWDLFAPDLPPALAEPSPHRIAAMFALDPAQADRAIVAARSALRRLGWHVMSWRDVPMNLEALDAHRRADAPRFVQCFARAPRHRQKRTPYRTRLAVEARWLWLGLSGCSVVSLSDTTIIYKGLTSATALPRLFPDLADSRFSSWFAVLHHQTAGPHAVPRWDLAQPFHGVAHAGTVATINGNRLWMDVRIGDAGIRDDADLPKNGGSDAQTLDSAVQWLRESGLSTSRAVARLLAPAWEDADQVAPEVRAFRRHEACHAEPWDGPAAIAFGDGACAGAMVDRNGMRPLYTLEAADVVCVASQPAAFDGLSDATAMRGALSAGELFVVDPDGQRVLRGEAAARDLAAHEDYTARAARLIHRLPHRPRTSPAAIDHVFDCEPERDATSLRVLLGRRGQWMAQALAPVLLELDTPVLVDAELTAMLEQAEVRAAVLPIGFDPRAGTTPGDALRSAVAMLQTTAAALVANGTRILVLSDRRVEPVTARMPALLATKAVDEGLRKARLRLRASLVVDSAAIRDADHIAALASAGASAVLPYVLYDVAASEYGQPIERCRRTLEADLRTILTSLGLSSFEALCSSRLFEPVSLGDIAPKVQPATEDDEPSAMTDGSAYMLDSELALTGALSRKDLLRS